MFFITLSIYIVVNLFHIIYRVLKICSKNKKSYLHALLNLADRIAVITNNISDSIVEQEIRFMKLSDLIKDKNSKAIMIFKLYSLSEVIKQDMIKTKKTLIFPYDPIKLFYMTYGKALNDLPQLKQELK